MWWTQTGERVLTGAAAELFGHALGVVLDEVEETHRDAQSEDDEWTASLTAFDDLTYGQKIQVFTTVAEGLLLPDLPPERAREVRELLAITPDYHQAIPDDLTEKQAAAALARIKQLLHRVAPD
jgi:hypothetical protein